MMSKNFGCGFLKQGSRGETILHTIYEYDTLQDAKEYRDYSWEMMTTGKYDDYRNVTYTLWLVERVQEGIRFFDHRSIRVGQHINNQIIQYGDEGGKEREVNDIPVQFRLYLKWGEPREVVLS